MHLDLYSLQDNKIEPFKDCGNSFHYWCGYSHVCVSYSLQFKQIYHVCFLSVLNTWCLINTLWI